MKYRFIIVVLILFLTGCSTTVTQNIHLKYGNPSRAGGDRDNYLIERPQYALSYNCQAGIANWVSWELDRSWLGTVDRSNDFRPDLDLPDSCYRVRPNDYRGSGYDRGHLIPSGDRTDSELDNSSTFLMTNMVPQSPSNNREVWRELEEYGRQLALSGNKLYIVAGSDGITRKIANSQITVPEYVWKVILVIEPVTEAMDTIAVWMPNSEQVRNTDWQDYIVSVDLIEQQTGYDFFAKVPRRVQKEIEQAYYQQSSIKLSTNNDVN